MKNGKNGKRPAGLTISGAARLFNRDRGTIRKLIANLELRPVGMERGSATFSVEQVAQGLFGVPQGTGEDLSPGERLSWFRSEIARRQLQVTDGELIPAADFDAEYSRLIKLTAAALETLPDRLELDAGLTGAQLDPVIRTIDGLRESLYQSLVDRGNID